MLTLDHILSSSMSAEEYLQSQRERLRGKHDGICREIKESGKELSWREDLLRRADLFMRNMYLLPGTGGKPMFVGDPPAWNVRLVHDEEYLWGLNRLPEQGPLCRAYLLTGEKKYAEKALANILNWIEVCPCPDFGTDDPVTLRRRFNNTVDISPWRILEAGIRLFDSWRNAYICLLYSDLMTPEVHETMIRSMHEQAQVLSHVSPIIWPNADHNHFFHEMLGLLCASIDHPEWKQSAQWQEQSIRELIRCCQAQITPEGGQLEGCPGYHGGCLTMMFSIVKILRENSLEIPAVLSECINKASLYSVWTMKPTGILASVGDTGISAGNLPHQTEIHHSLFGNYGIFEKIRPLISDTTPTEDFPGGIMHFRTLGQITARSGWTKDDSFFMLCCNTPVPNGHSHQDPMSFVLTLNGRDIVTDPSSCTYQDGDKRKLYKSPEYHSCLTFGGRPPFEYVSTWVFGPQKEGKTGSIYSCDGLLAGDAMHMNYEPNEHRRLCALVDKDAFLVADDVVNKTGETVRMYFHMDTPDWTITDTGAADEFTSVYLPAGTEWSLADSSKSPRSDVEIPTRRIVVTDENPAEEALYVTVFSASADITDISACRCDDGIRISYRKAGVPVCLLWKYGISCEKI